MEKELLLDNENLNKKLIKICWPIFIQFALYMLLGSIDTFMLGRYSDDAVGAVGVVNQIITMVLLIFEVITSGTTILCSQYIGAKKEKEDMFKVVGTSIKVNLILGVVVSLAMLFFATPILRMMNLKGEMLEFGRQYIVIVGGFVIFQAIDSTFTAIIISYGFTKVTMFATLIMNVVNIGLNYSLIYGNFGLPRLGVEGAAIGTTISKLVGGIILGIFLFRKIIIDFKLKYIYKSYKEEFKKILFIGVPSAGESVAYNIAKLVDTVILTHISIVAVNTNSYINNIIMYIYILAVSIGQGTAILVGRLAGSGEEDKAYKLCLSSFKKAFMASLVVSLIVAILSKNIFHIFTDNMEIIKLGSTILFLDIILETGRTFNVVIINCLRAAGDVRFPVYIGIISMWTIGVGLAFILAIPCKLGFPGMWLALALDEWVRGIIMHHRWRKGSWRGRTFV